MQESLFQYFFNVFLCVSCILEVSWLFIDFFIAIKKNLMSNEQRKKNKNKVFTKQAIVFKTMKDKKFSSRIKLI
jgi:hypothetical protein